MESNPGIVRKAFVQKLRDMGIEKDCVPRVIKDIGFLLEANPLMGCREITNRLRVLGWSDIEIDYHMSEMAKASFEKERCDHGVS